MMKLLTGAMLAGAVPAPALAQEQAPSAPPPLTRDGVQAMVRQHFDRIDADHDGKVTRTEAEAARGSMQRGGGGASSPPSQGGKAPGHRMRGMDGAGMMGMLNGRTFDRVDANGDGTVTAEEATASALRLFDAADTDHDGTISSQERDAARARMIAERIRDRQQ
jgi:hypothetical protein